MEDVEKTAKDVISQMLSEDSFCWDWCIFQKLISAPKLTLVVRRRFLWAQFAEGNRYFPFLKSVDPGEVDPPDGDSASYALQPLYRFRQHIDESLDDRILHPIEPFCLGDDYKIRLPFDDIGRHRDIPPRPNFTALTSPLAKTCEDFSSV
jgi:hypothetical protein